MRTAINIIMYFLACVGLWAIILWLYMVIGEPSTFTDFEGIYTGLTAPFIIEFLLNLQRKENSNATY